MNFVQCSFKRDYLIVTINDSLLMHEVKCTYITTIKDL